MPDLVNDVAKDGGQPFDFWFSESLLADLAGRPLRDLHFEADAIVEAYDAVKPLAERLGVAAPEPKLPGFAYTHIAALGAEIRFAETEPVPVPLLKSPEDIDRLREPSDYLASEIIQQRLALLDEMRRRRPETLLSIGHLLEGPITTAAVLMGGQFFTLPYDDPERAHRFLGFCVDSSLHYARAVRTRLGFTSPVIDEGFPDDFAGIFPPAVFADFVVPYWERLYRGLGASKRWLHSELLRPGHLRFLSGLAIASYDPSADQYLTPEVLRERCPVTFQCRIMDWHVADLSASELQALYRRFARFRPEVIGFCLTRAEDEPKIRALLETARELGPGTTTRAECCLGSG